MPFNLIADAWLPVRRLAGRREWICPADLTSRFGDDPIVALDFPRPDWNAAVTELLIGLLAVVMPPEDTAAWADLWAEPPTPEVLREKLRKIAFAFNLDGEGVRCFQDFDPLTDQEPKPVTALRIDAPGENAEKKNTDLFVKRANDTAMSFAIAAAALVTLQTFAPAGGQGNRTSMRGGGPLTTLPLPRRKLDFKSGTQKSATTLWDLVWAAVPSRGKSDVLPDNEKEAAWARIFPWLATARTSENDRSTLPQEHAHSVQAFFGTPRRIRLDITPADGVRCAFEGPAGQTVVRTFRQKNFGVKYEGWVHPLTPYRQDKKAGLLAFHPQPGGATYRDWMTWVESLKGKSQRAACLDAWGHRVERLVNLASFGGEFEAGEPWQSGMLAFGYDMDNMKARGWLEARVPFFDPPSGADPAKWSEVFRRNAERLVAGTEETAKALRVQVKVASAGVRDREGRYRIPDTLPKEAFVDLIEQLWRATEPPFRKALAELREHPGDAELNVRKGFLATLRRQALAMFDETASIDTLADQDARRIVEARSYLQGAFGPRAAVAKALDIAPAADPDDKPKGKGRKLKKKDAGDGE